MQDLCSARLQSEMAGDKDKSIVSGVLLSLLALITALQHQFAIIYNLIFQTQQQRAMILQLNHTATISRFQIARRKIRRGPARRLRRAPGRTEEKDSKIHYFPLTFYFGPCILKTTLALHFAHQYRRLLRWAEIFKIVGLLSF